MARLSFDNRAEEESEGSAPPVELPVADAQPGFDSMEAIQDVEDQIAIAQASAKAKQVMGDIYADVILREELNRSEIIQMGELLDHGAAEMTRLRKTVQERDAEISRLGGVVTFKDAELKHLQKKLQERDSELERVHDLMLRRDGLQQRRERTAQRPADGPAE